MPIAAAAPVLVFIPISCNASPRTRVMSSPGRASEPTARIHTTSGLTSTDVALLILTSARSVGLDRRGRCQRGAHRQHHAEREEAEGPPQPERCASAQTLPQIFTASSTS